MKRHYYFYRKFGFTLAEVLITLGIIGIVAALTMPTLISKHNKMLTETRLASFYSKMNNALKLSEIDNGEAKYWEQIPNSGEDKVTWFNKYVFPYMKIGKTRVDRTDVYIYMLDGSVLYIGPYRCDWYFFPKGSKMKNAIMGKNRFLFNFSPYDSSWARAYGKLMIPYISGWDGTEAHLKSSCAKQTEWPGSTLCTKLIEYNGWKIPDDYPYKF